ncbi:MAG: hypothetical protein HQK51_02540 [Oligoflexia bacterium]|nr:hypothetical protein [Oligoflexia bacterium]
MYNDLIFEANDTNVLKRVQEEMAKYLENPSNIIINCCCLEEIDDEWITYFLTLRDNLLLYKKKIMLLFTINIQKKLFIYKKNNNIANHKFIDTSPNLLYAMEVFIRNAII